MNNTFYVFFFIILIMSIIINFLPNNYNDNNSVLNYRHSLIFEISELLIIIYFIIYCFRKKYILNAIMLSIAFFEHCKQLYFCYRQKGGKVKNLLTGILYILMITYNIIEKNYLFNLIWFGGLLIHLISFILNKSFVKILCVK
jgi:hypothetical protein